jgi:hypothetical protein
MKYIKKLIVGNNFNLLSLNNYDVTVDALDILIEIPKIKLLNNYYIDLIEISKNQKIKIQNFNYIKDTIEYHIFLRLKKEINDPVYKKTIEDYFANNSPELSFKYADEILNGRFIAAEKILVNNVKILKNYIERFFKDDPEIIEKEFPEYERKLALDGESAFWYAKFIKKAFPLGEPEILQDNYRAYLYAKNILQRRWDKLEKKLISEKDIKNILEYNSEFFENREWPEIEEILIEDDEKQYQKEIKSLNIEQIQRLKPQIKNILLYCKINLRNQRFHKAEEYILKNPKNILEYLKEVVKGSWKEAEIALRDYYLKHKIDSSKYYIFNYLNISEQPSKILEEFIDDKYYIIRYCKNNLNGKRFLSGEKHILNSSPSDIYEYIREIIRGPWPEAEPVLLESKSFYIADYANEFLKKPWPEAEPLILNLNHYRITEYVKQCLKGERFKLAEPELMNNYNSLLEYIKSLKDVFPEGINKLIELDVENATKYICYDFKKRWEPLERKFIEIKKGSEYLPVLYSKEILKKPWLEATEVDKEIRDKVQEKILKNDNLALLDYVRDVYKKPVPEFENLFNERYKEYYLSFIKEYTTKKSKKL